ncbi:MAG: ankyrin repeat domain-containing protein [Sphingomicrobium sp.]
MRQAKLAIAAVLVATAIPGPIGAQVAHAGSDLVEAVRKGDGGKAAGLLENSPAGLVNSRGEDGDTALIVAIRRRDEDFTGFLLNKGADPNAPGKNGETPLIAASRLGSDTAVEWLLQTGAKVDGTNRSGETSLIVAVETHQAVIVRRLLEAGADPDKADHAQGFSAREYATRDPRSRDILKLITNAKPKR